MKKGLMVLVLALCVCNVYAQAIKGKVVDEKSQPIAYATVLLLNKEDSSFVKGVTRVVLLPSPCLRRKMQRNNMPTKIL